MDLSYLQYFLSFRFEDTKLKYFLLHIDIYQHLVFNISCHLRMRIKKYFSHHKDKFTIWIMIDKYGFFMLRTDIYCGFDFDISYHLIMKVNTSFLLDPDKYHNIALNISCRSKRSMANLLQ